MKKPFLIAVLVFVAVLAGGAAYAYYWTNNTLGLSESEYIGFETSLDPETRFIALLQPDRMMTFLHELLPQESAALPSWVPWDLKELVDRVTPREVAMMAGVDHNADVALVRIFANEKMGGPMIVARANELDAFKTPGRITWNDPPLELTERGKLVASGKFPIPAKAKAHTQNLFDINKAGLTAEVLTRDHLFEAILDNREGDLLAIIGALMEQGGGDMDTLMQDPNVPMILSNIETGRAYANLTGPDEITIHLSLKTLPNTPLQARLAMLFAVNELGFPEAQRNLALYNLNLEFQNNRKADFKDGALVGTFVLTGFRDRVEASLASAIP